MAVSHPASLFPNKTFTRLLPFNIKWAVSGVTFADPLLKFCIKTCTQWSVTSEIRTDQLLTLNCMVLLFVPFKFSAPEELKDAHKQTSSSFPFAIIAAVSKRGVAGGTKQRD